MTPTAAMLAPNETAILAHPTDDGLADVELFWADANHTLCRSTMHTRLAGLVTNLHACGCTVRALDADTEALLHQVHERVAW
jgi:hypothetical protein